MSNRKKLITVSVILTAVVFSSVLSFAEERAEGEFFLKEIVINGEEIVNYNLTCPFFLYNDVTYIPLTAELGRVCGFEAVTDTVARAVEIRKVEPVAGNLAENWMKNNAEAVDAVVDRNMRLIACEGDADDLNPVVKAALDAIMVFAPAEPSETRRELTLGDSPVVMKDGVACVPLKALAGENALGWDIFFDPNFGLCISTDGETIAKAFFPQAEAEYNKGLAAYIDSQNATLGITHAQRLVFLFRRAAELNALDEKLLMAVAQKESSFRADAVSRSGAIGMMQFMPGTAAGLGLTTEQLKDAKTSIDFGAAYISQKIADYGGNVDIALSAYNYGSRNVSRGAYTRVYAERIQDIANGIDVYLNDGGYVAGN